MKRVNGGGSQKLRVKSVHFKTCLKCVFDQFKALFQRFNPVLIKLEIWPKPKCDILSRQLTPTVLAKPWDCLQYCWSCVRFLVELNLHHFFFSVAEYSNEYCIQQLHSSQNPIFVPFLCSASFSLCLQCKTMWLLHLNSLRYPKPHPPKTDDDWGVLLEHLELKVLWFPP